MAVERIQTPDDPRVAAYAMVADRELLLARGLFVAEGRLVVMRVLHDPRFRVRSLLVSDATLAALSGTLESAASDVPIFGCPASLFEHIAGHKFHRGCLALVERPPRLSAEQLAEGASLVIVLEGVTDPDNVGSVFRNAAAFGADAVLLSPSTCDPLYRKAIRTSMAATLSVPFARISAWPEGLTELRRRGFTIVALTPRDPAEPLEAFARAPRPARIALLVGTEGAGHSEEALALADVRVRIPMRPGIDSVNLSVATGIVLSRLWA